jgi:hypothetical protein
MVHMASSWRSREDEAEDRRVDTTDCIGACHPYFSFSRIMPYEHFGLLVFWFGI